MDNYCHALMKSLFSQTFRPFRLKVDSWLDYAASRVDIPDYIRHDTDVVAPEDLLWRKHGAETSLQRVVWWCDVAIPPPAEDERQESAVAVGYAVGGC